MGGLFGKTPKVETPAPAPTPDDKEVDEARRRRIALAQQQSGIRSSVLSSGKRETLGAG